MPDNHWPVRVGAHHDKGDAGMIDETRDEPRVLLVELLETHLLWPAWKRDETQIARGQNDDLRSLDRLIWAATQRRFNGQEIT